MIDPLTGLAKSKFAHAPRPADGVARARLELIIGNLRRALEQAKLADCPRLANKIRSAIKSHGGAERHMIRRINYTKANLNQG